MSASAFGVEHSPTEVSKRRKENKDITGSALTAGGSVATGAGLLGGGIPGIKSNSEVIDRIRDPKKPWAQRVGATLASARGGIFGYRTDAHQKAKNRFEADHNLYKDKPATRFQMYQRGRTAGKISPETQVIRHLKTGRKISNVMLGAGIASTAYGVKTLKDSDQNKIKKSQSDTDRFHAALLGGGATLGGGSVVANKVLLGQQKRWKDRYNQSMKEAAGVVPRLKDAATPDVEADPNNYFAGKSKQKAYEAGIKRGHATQQKYFASVYGKTAKVARKLRGPSLATAAVGGTGLLLSRKQNKR